MVTLIWVGLPYAAAFSCLAGHLWRYRHDRFLGHLYGPRLDRTQRFGVRAFRIGIPVLFATRVAEVLASGPDSGPEGATRVVLTALLLLAVPLALVGVGLIMIPPLIDADPHARVTPVDRLTLPVLIATMVSGVLVKFDPGPDDGRYTTAETLFTWVRSLVTLHPDPAAMAHAPAIYQARGLIILLLIAIWPYTRLAGIFAIPALRLLQRAAGFRQRSWVNPAT
ncbi:respiratory nitrate reductase subunit gamma [Nocardia sp. 2]|uniref:Respiratory nitrate reductase subunit gamma n=1 Tax=Nocardia acididurans TaxID=2802282 RepID=A0ABS1M3L1_9NOCA|nr:respiratory nitrate reductase subunit gamma [Nocardia acididurans]MBL1074764.1 respiratory nitrate reductase subunit gamma [Nocardia acididurans]